METQWRGHTIKVVGDWTSRWLFLAPQYELWLDDQQLDVSGGPNLHPSLTAVYVDEEAETELVIEAELFSIAGVRPSCDIYIGEDKIASGRVHVQNLMVPVLVLIILASSLVVYFIGPKVLW